MSEKEGLLEWELNYIQKIDPSLIRKRLREELDYLYSVGTIVDAIKHDDLLSHILAYAWESTYRLALVCKRFWIITKSRAYWAELAKHALKDEIPAKVLSSINFFYFIKDTDPAHLHLQGLLKKFKFARNEESTSLYLYHPYDYQRKGRLTISWANKKDSVVPSYFLEYALFKNANPSEIIAGELHTRVFVNHDQSKKLCWFSALTPDTKKKVLRCVYCEIYDPDRNQTWYGQPGMTESFSNILPSGSDLYPTPYSFGVWK